MEKKFNEKIFIDNYKMQIQSNIQTLKNKNIDTSNLKLFIVHKYLTKTKKQNFYKNFETEENIKILNLEEYNPLLNYNNYLNDFIPFIKKGDKYLPIYGRDFNKNKKIIIENKNNFSIISINFEIDEHNLLFTGPSRMSIVKKILYRKLEEKYFNKLQFNNLFILKSEDMKNDIKKRLENLNLFDGDKSYNNYYLEESEFKESKEHSAYKINDKQNIYLIIDDKGIVKYKGCFTESDFKMDTFLEKMLINEGKKNFVFRLIYLFN
jgi:hypothetical protein